MNTITAISGVVIKELYRRKDFYVLFVLVAVLTGLMGSMNFFHDEKIVRWLKEFCLMLIWIASLIIAIVTTARQIPAERENRTIFPLLAKPVSRAQVILGKFLGCWLASGLTLVVFYVFFGIVSGTREQQWAILQLLQGFCLQWVMLGIVVSLVLLGSVLLSTPSVNTTVSFLVVVGILFVGPHLNQVALQQHEPVRSGLYFLYYFIPHLEWYDVRDLIIYDWGRVSWGDCLLAALYGACYSGLALFGTWLVFRRKALNT